LTDDSPAPPPGARTPDPMIPPAREPPSRVVAAVIGVLAILPTLMLALLMPEMFKATREGAMQPIHLLGTLLAWVLLPGGIALLFFRKRGAATVFALATLAGLSTIGSPFARIVLGGVMVSVIGGVVAWLRERPPRP
jgi:hypothetical protein